MRVVIQRVSEASVMVANNVVGQIEQGLLVLLGIGAEDSAAEASLLAEKTATLRIFSDEDGRFNLSVQDVGGGILVVSQFTLYADTRKGRRPSFAGAAPPEQAVPLVETFLESLRKKGLFVATGIFGAHMKVALVNDGPVTITLDSATFRESRRGTS
ncbi:MAG: D-tyrosyl-tRNA(Tyr) deacylase [Chloroflexi bacterium AL-W]|nr:D-tyrosyl-tRNA(Tyr) deacylase [Chloroflexi bacterium AL-N1]NOK65757.1 D-tyrosyl-tRNA(Tyr) deacylase [Chloroflexi bacterium AL-N10]NOK74302.1 D-tyrosyl-tRNA(Tyr) deacylase [Chloroflexi bacterium AL-N5]NOK80790.1 D-tyrosyl-tRNA(Tyr) deacylase [Chloroflexi bacterium AL-W]NOK88560.1 D-tyrosyl-tRNA(Tyr) deacylase [Chloroflexi bacterium AL-N15]